MKKTMILLLAILFCLPVSGLATDESQFIGTWIQETYNEETGRYSYELLCLTADHQAYYSVQSFEPGKEGFGRQSAKTWSIKGDGIHIILGNTAETDAFILSDGRLGFKLIGDAYSPFTRVDDKKEEINRTAESIKNGVTIPQGEYTIGEFIKPGTYRVTLARDDVAVIWVTKPGDIVGDFYGLASSEGETEAIVQLEEGYSFKVQYSSVILSEMTGF